MTSSSSLSTILPSSPPALNANMRRIDLLCKLASPAVAGVILQYTGSLTTTIVVALWNVISFFAELGLLRVVFHLVPTLAVKKLRKQSTIGFLDDLMESEEQEEDKMREEGKGGGEAGGEGEGERKGGRREEGEGEEEREEGVGKGEEVEGEGEGGEGEQETETEEEELVSVGSKSRRARKRRRRSSSSSILLARTCSRLLTPYTSIRDGWRTYIRQEIALAGFAMAAIYLTVLGFSGVTSSYFLSQGLRSDLIGLAMALGAVCGVSGTFLYPIIRGQIGTVRTGLVGISSQLLMLLFCAVAVLIPSHRVANPAESYYAANCPAEGGTSNLSLPFCALETSSISFLATPSSSLPLPTLPPSPTSSLPLIPTPTQLPLTPSPSPSTTTQTTHLLLATVTSVSPTMASSPTVASGSGEGLSGDGGSGDGGSGDDSLLRPLREARDEKSFSPAPTPPSTCLPLPPTPSPSPKEEGGRSSISVALILMLIGVTLARFGLWMFDLAVQQLVQETVVEEERGVVGGVMNAMNSIMDMLHYVLVIAAPRPEHFSILTLISVGMVTLGLVLYAAYVRKVRGHFFHFRKYCGYCWSRVGRRRGQLVFSPVQQGEGDQKSFVNESVEAEEHEL